MGSFARERFRGGVLVFRDQAVTKTSPAINQHWMSDPMALLLMMLTFRPGRARALGRDRGGEPAQRKFSTRMRSAPEASCRE